MAIAGPTMTITLTITRGSMNAQAMIVRPSAAAYDPPLREDAPYWPRAPRGPSMRVVRQASGGLRSDDWGYLACLEFLLEDLVEFGAVLGRRRIAGEDFLHTFVDVHVRLGWPEGPSGVPEVAFRGNLAQGRQDVGDPGSMFEGSPPSRWG